MGWISCGLSGLAIRSLSDDKKLPGLISPAIVFVYSYKKKKKTLSSIPCHPIVVILVVQINLWSFVPSFFVRTPTQTRKPPEILPVYQSASTKRKAVMIPNAIESNRVRNQRQTMKTVIPSPPPQPKAKSPCHSCHAREDSCPRSAALHRKSAKRNSKNGG